MYKSLFPCRELYTNYENLANLLMFLSLALLPSRAFAGEPTAQLSATINEFVTIMVTWRVYDVVIEHVSIVSNFRAQFEREISRTSVKALLEKIKQRKS